MVVERVCKRFGSLEVLKDVSFRVERGKVVTLLGPNGAGKSTLMRILTGILLPASGTVWIEGHRMDREPLQAKRHLGYLPEQTPFYPELTVLEYLRFVAAAKGVQPAVQKEKVQEVLHRCDIEEFQNRRMGILSKGTLRRVGIAQAIVNNPSVLILDEPTSGLDPSQALIFRNLILELKKETAIVLSTHLMIDASALSDQVLFMHRGQILLEDTVEGLKKRFAERNAYEVRIRTKGSAETEASIRKVLSEIEGILEVNASLVSDPHTWRMTVFTQPGWNPASGFLPALTSRNWDLLELQQRTMDLEEVFGEITRGVQTRSGQ